MQRLCGWCRTPNEGEGHDCTNCGGPLPAPPGADPGPAPGPTPRSLPDGYAGALYRNFLVAIGSIFGVVGGAITLGFGIAALSEPFLALAAAFGSLFVAIGGGFIYAGVRAARRTIRVLETGRATRGRVSGIVASGSTWTLAYLYDVEEGTLGGTLQTTDTIVSHYRDGDALHVVFEVAEPKSSSVWPPIRVEI